MKIRVKWILTALAALLAGVVVTAYAILAAFDLDDLRAEIEGQARAATGRSLSIGGPMDLKVALTPAIAIENVSFGNAPWGAWPELFSVRRLEVELRLLPLLSGAIVVRRLVAIEPTILLETNAEGQGNWVIEGPEAVSEATPGAAESEPTGPDAIPAFRRIVVRDGRAIYRDGQSGREYLVEVQSLDARADSPDSPSSLTLEGRYDGVAFAAGGTFGSRDELLGGGRVPLDLKVEAGKTTLEAKGAITELAAARGLDLEVDLRGARLSELGALIGEDLPLLGPYALTGRLGDTENGIKLAGLALTLGDSDLAGNAAIAYSGERPAIAANLSAGALDLKDFTGPAGDAAEAGPARVFSDERLPLAALHALDARVKLNAEQARFDDKTMLSDLSLTLDLNNGRLAVRDLQAGFSGGALSGELALDAGLSDPPLSLELRAKDFDYGHFLQGRDVTEGVDGKLDARAELRAAGSSLHAWAESLNGRVELTGGEGRVRSGLLSASGAGLIDMLSDWREGDDDLKLNCVVMRLPVEDGVVKAEAVLIDTAAVTVGATGTVDLGAETLDMKVTPQAKQTSLMSLAVPVRVGGTLLEPNIGPDALGTALGAAAIAGMFINPLVAGAVIILDSELSDENPCVAAIEGGARRKYVPAAPGEDGETEDLGEGETRG